MVEALLEVQNLRITTREHAAEALVGPLSFSLEPGATALVGESGSGKSLTVRALLGLLPPNLQMQSTQLRFAGQDLRALREPGWQALRGKQIGLVMQDPRYALNPRRTVGEQVDQALRLHTSLSRTQRRERVLESLAEVGLPQPRNWLQHYPHQLSGGLGQRVMLAIAMLHRPRLLIADEPTSALDASLREQILQLMLRLLERHGMSLLLISHDLPLVAAHCREALVMYRGQLVDRCAADALDRANSPYTRALWACRPSGASHGEMLPVFDPASLEVSA